MVSRFRMSDTCSRKPAEAPCQHGFGEKLELVSGSVKCCNCHVCSLICFESGRFRGISCLPGHGPRRAVMGAVAMSGVCARRDAGVQMLFDDAMHDPRKHLGVALPSGVEGNQFSRRGEPHVSAARVGRKAPQHLRI